MKKIIVLFLIISILTGCSNKTDTISGSTEKVDGVSNPTKESVQYKKITIDDAYNNLYVEDNIVTLIDVRTKEEYSEGHLRNAINIPYGEITNATLPKDKNSSIILYCRSGIRAENAAKALVSLGYTNVSTFGGIMDWTYKDEIVK